MMIIENQREEQILKLAFEQQGIKIIPAKPTYQYYVMAQQYVPDLVILELPHICIERCHFTSLLRKNKRTKNLPVIAYGNPIDPMILKTALLSGINNFLERPLKFTNLLKLVDTHLKKKQTKRYLLMIQNPSLKPMSN